MVLFCLHTQKCHFKLIFFIFILHHQKNIQEHAKDTKKHKYIKVGL